MVNLGHKLEKFWETELVDRTRIANVCASNFPAGRMLRMSVPVLDDSGNHTAAVFNLKFGEDELPNAGLIGAWTRYTNIYATCWSNRDGVSYFATDKGYVGCMAFTGNDTDYSDLGQAIKCDVTFRATDGGMPAIRKVLKFITLYADSRHDSPGHNLEVFIANDFGETFVELDQAVFRGSVPSTINGITDLTAEKIVRIAYSPRWAHATWFQIRLTSETNRADFSINKLIYNLAALRTRGSQQAGQTK